MMIGAIPPLMRKTPANPDGLPIEVLSKTNGLVLHTAALINYAFLAHAVWTTDQAVTAMGYTRCP